MTMMMARPSKDGRSVLCGMVDCGKALAWIMEPDKRLLERERFVWFPPGWAWRKDGVWAVTTRARRRLRGDWYHPSGQPPQAVKVYVNQEVGTLPIGWIPFTPHEAVCPGCGMRQVLQGDALGIPPYRPSGAWPGNAALRQLLPGPEVERWEREPLRFQ
jgi:hypothetical protein